MSSANYDSRTADKFVVRLPDGLRPDIEAAANASDAATPGLHNVGSSVGARFG